MLRQLSGVQVFLFLNARLPLLDPADSPDVGLVSARYAGTKENRYRLQKA